MSRRIKLTVRGADVRIARVRGDLTVQAQAGELTASELEGAVDIESNNTEVTLDRLDATKSPIHVTATNGSVKINGARTDTRIDARNAEVTVSLARPTTLAVYADGGEQVEVTPAPRRLPARCRHERRRTHLGAGQTRRFEDRRQGRECRAARIRSRERRRPDDHGACYPRRDRSAYAGFSANARSTRTAETSCAAATSETLKTRVALIRRSGKLPPFARLP